MARTQFAVLALALLATCALAEETRVNPVSNAAAGAVGIATAPIVSAVTSVSGDAAQGELCCQHYKHVYIVAVKVVHTRSDPYLGAQRHGGGL
jgi:hypothetical protein